MMGKPRVSASPKATVGNFFMRGIGTESVSTKRRVGYSLAWSFSCFTGAMSSLALAGTGSSLAKTGSSLAGAVS